MEFRTSELSVVELSGAHCILFMCFGAPRKVNETITLTGKGLS